MAHLSEKQLEFQISSFWHIARQQWFTNLSSSAKTIVRRPLTRKLGTGNAVRIRRHSRHELEQGGRRSRGPPALVAATIAGIVFPPPITLQQENIETQQRGCSVLGGYIELVSPRKNLWVDNDARTTFIAEFYQGCLLSHLMVHFIRTRLVSAQGDACFSLRKRHIYACGLLFLSTSYTHSPCNRTCAQGRVVGGLCVRAQVSLPLSLLLYTRGDARKRFCSNTAISQKYALFEAPGCSLPSIITILGNKQQPGDASTTTQPRHVHVLPDPLFLLAGRARARPSGTRSRPEARCASHRGRVPSPTLGWRQPTWKSNSKAGEGEVKRRLPWRYEGCVSVLQVHSGSYSQWSIGTDGIFFRVVAVQAVKTKHHPPL